jgi:hypothetical protein
VLPIAVTRWLGFTGHQVPWAATVFADVVFASSGYLNVLLFTLTRPRLLPERETKDSGRPLSAADRFTPSTPQPSSLSTFHSRMNSQFSDTMADVHSSPHSIPLHLNTTQINDSPKPRFESASGSPQLGSPMLLMPPGV